MSPVEIGLRKYRPMILTQSPVTVADPELLLLFPITKFRNESSTPSSSSS